MATRSRPAQGNNSSRPFNRPRPAYKPDLVPKVTSAGSLSHPKDTTWRLQGRLNSDATPKVVAL